MKKRGLLFFVASFVVFAAFSLGLLWGRSFTRAPVLVSKAAAEAAQAAETIRQETQATTVPDAERIDLNRATQAQLMTLPGIGQTLSRRILDYRDENGPFQTVTELMNVEGIGEKRMEALIDLVCVGGP